MASIRLNKVDALVKAFGGVVDTYLGAELKGTALTGFVDDIFSMISKANYEAVVDSIRPLAGRKLDVETGTELCWRLAGNYTKLLAGETVQPWAKQVDNEWVDVQVTNVVDMIRTFKSKDSVGPDGNPIYVGRHGVEVSFLILTGSPAGRRFSKFMSFDLCDLLKSHFGFDKFNRERYSTKGAVSRWPFSEAIEFYGLRVQIKLSPALIVGQEIDFRECRASSSTKRWSRQIMSMRLREEFNCPAGYPDRFPCHKCPKGFEACPAACHPRNFVKRPCPRCLRDSRYFNLDSPLQHCIGCPGGKED